MFSSMANRLASSGYLIIGYVESSGLIQRLFHRALINKVNETKSDEATYQLARKYFGEHIDRSVKFEKRTELGMINDYLVNSHYHGLKGDTILAWREALGLTLYNAWPQRSVPLRVDGCNYDSFEGKERGANFAGVHDLAWCFAQLDGYDVWSNLSTQLESFDSLADDFIGEAHTRLQNFDFENLDEFRRRGLMLKSGANKSIEGMAERVIEMLSNCIEDLVQEFEKLDAFRDNVEVEVVSSRSLYRGLNGLSTSYLIFRKGKQV